MKDFSSMKTWSMANRLNIIRTLAERIIKLAGIEEIPREGEIIDLSEIAVLLEESSNKRGEIAGLAMLIIYLKHTDSKVLDAHRETIESFLSQTDNSEVML